MATFPPHPTDLPTKVTAQKKVTKQKMMALSLVSPATGVDKLGNLRRDFRVFSFGAYSNGNGNDDGVFPSFLPKQIENIKDPFARSLAQRIQRLPVQVKVTHPCFCFRACKPSNVRVG